MNDPVDGTRPEPAPEEAPATGRRDVGIDPSDLSIALTPKQIISGFALLAALVMLLRRRDRRDTRRD